MVSFDSRIVAIASSGDHAIATAPTMALLSPKVTGCAMRNPSLALAPVAMASCATRGEGGGEGCGVLTLGEQGLAVSVDHEGGDRRPVLGIEEAAKFGVDGFGPAEPDGAARGRGDGAGHGFGLRAEAVVGEVGRGAEARSRGSSRRRSRSPPP